MWALHAELVTYEYGGRHSDVTRQNRQRAYSRCGRGPRGRHGAAWRAARYPHARQLLAASLRVFTQISNGPTPAVPEAGHRERGEAILMARG